MQLLQMEMLVMRHNVAKTLKITVLMNNDVPAEDLAQPFKTLMSIDSKIQKPEHLFLAMLF